MSATANQPTNKNFLSPLGFVFQIKKAPNLNFFTQSVSIPSFTLGTVDVENPFVKIPFPGDKINFSALDVTFKVDENLANYREIYNWIVAIGYPDEFLQRQAIEEAGDMSGSGVYSDLSLIITTSNMKPNYEVTFYDAYPYSLTELQFDSTLTDVTYLTCTASFQYRAFKLVKLT